MNLEEYEELIDPIIEFRPYVLGDLNKGDLFMFDKFTDWKDIIFVVTKEIYFNDVHGCHYVGIKPWHSLQKGFRGNMGAYHKVIPVHSY